MNTKKIQLVITVVLVIVLVGIVGGYIYYGMRFAKLNEVPPVAMTEQATSSEVFPTGMTRQEKIKILDSLSEKTEVSSSVPLADREKILNSLTLTTSSSGKGISDEEKQKIMQSLQKP